MMITTRRDNVNVTLRTTTIGGEDTNDPFCGRPEIWASIVSIVLLPGQLKCLIYTVVYTVIYTESSSLARVSACVLSTLWSILRRHSGETLLDKYGVCEGRSLKLCAREMFFYNFH